MKALQVLLVTLILTGSMYAQDWEERTVGEVTFEFPDSAREYVTPNGTALTYNEDGLYLTVTTIPDSTSYSPDTRLEKTRYYAATVASVTRNLRGRMFDNRDTMIGDDHLYYTAVEVTMPDSAVSIYEIMQYMPDDTLRAFTCQYIAADMRGRKARDKFFSSISWPGAGLEYAIPRVVFYVLGGALLIFVIAYFGLSRNLNAL